MTRDELETVIYERTRYFVEWSVMDCILELIAAEREACAEYAAALAEAGWSAGSIADAIRARGSDGTAA